MKEAFKTALCSTDFLFLGEGASPENSGPLKRLNDKAIAERLAFWFWNSLPDGELLALAGEGRLRQPEDLKKQTDRLLADPRSDRFISDFADQWLDLRKIDATEPDTRLYPESREHLKESMLAESRSYLRELITQNLSVTHLVHSRFAMLNQSLADHYGIPGVSGCTIRRVPLPEGSVRGPFLTQAAVLKVTANGTTTSPVTRGAWINERLLGNPIPPPPAGVPAIEPDTRGAKTIREQLEKHRADSRCAGCHAKMDPPGFALESFDAIGRWRGHYNLVNDKALPVDPSGEFNGHEFKDVVGFKKALVERQPQFARCLVEKLLTHALGRELGAADRPAIRRIVERAAADGYRLRDLVLLCCESELITRK